MKQFIGLRYVVVKDLLDNLQMSCIHFIVGSTIIIEIIIICNKSRSGRVMDLITQIVKDNKSKIIELEKLISMNCTKNYTYNKKGVLTNDA